MSPAIIPGDRILVEKFLTGARLFNPFAAARGKEFDIRRTPRFVKFKRNDVLVFNFVHRDSWDTIIMNNSVYYIKRCIAVPGDTVRIINYSYIVNSDTLSGYPSSDEYRYLWPCDSTLRAGNTRGYMSDINDTVDRWTIRDYGPLLVPGKGIEVHIDMKSYRRYRQMIERETGGKILVRDEKVFLNGEEINKYRFKENYYFMAGDNAMESMDSRYWGLVPEDFVVGRAGFIWWSERNGIIRWDRLLKTIR